MFHFLAIRIAGTLYLDLNQIMCAARGTDIVFNKYKDALIAGDFGLAARILWLTLKMEWQKGIHWLTEWWIAFKEVFMKTATDAFYGAVKILVVCISQMIDYSERLALAEGVPGGSEGVPHGSGDIIRIYHSALFFGPGLRGRNRTVLGHHIHF